MSSAVSKLSSDLKKTLTNDIHTIASVSSDVKNSKTRLQENYTARTEQFNSATRD